MTRNLVVVESPTKAKSIGKYLGDDYDVRASIGHVRDLPKSKLGVDVDGDMTPTYVVPKDSQAVVDALRKAAKRADEIWLATDLDREGEAIAWHVAEAIGVDSDAPNVHRVVFSEITREAILESFRQPRHIDHNLVDAQQARRVLDRLVGYTISPLLWRKIRPGLSAGRVQSVALRLIVDREREIKAFVADEYWSIEATLATAARERFRAGLHAVDGDRLDRLAVGSEAAARALETALEGAAYRVGEVREREVKRTPAPPFTTSTLQQEASRKLGFTARRTMSAAQQLYEGIDVGGADGQVGLITYMRTDSVNIAESALAEIAQVVREDYGEAFALAAPRRYRTRSRGAQEAHEAIRPTSAMRRPDGLARHLSSDQLRLYTLIWRRAVASQMAQAVFDSVSADIEATAGARVLTFRATGQVVKFAGFLAVYSEGRDDDEDPDAERRLPVLHTGDPLTLLPPLAVEQHFTQPPPRYTEASLVKALEELGIGRPSTYASIISVIQQRDYVTKDGRTLRPTDTGEVVTDLLVEHFNEIVDLNFTADWEERLDKVAEGEAAWVQLLRDFYNPFAELVEKKTAEITRADLTEATGRACPTCEDGQLVIKLGRYGKFVSCTNYPECRYAEQIAREGEEARPEPQRLDKLCPACLEAGRGENHLELKRGRFGAFVGCSAYPECKYIHPDYTGVGCPVCGLGQLSSRKSRYGKLFYSCHRYPECDYAVWSRPLRVVCPDCGGLLTATANGAKCQDCNHSFRGEALPEEPDLDEVNPVRPAGPDAETVAARKALKTARGAAKTPPARSRARR